MSDGWPTVDWVEDTPENQGLDKAKLDAAVTFARKKLPQAKSLLVVRHGKLVLESYFQGLSRDSLHRTASVTKSVISLLCGVAVRKGLIASLDARVADLLPAAVPLVRGTPKERMTLRNLISMTSGLGADEKQVSVADSSADPSLMYLALRAEHEPGTIFNYNESMQVVSRILTEVCKTSAARFAETELFGPLGIKSYWWPVDFPLQVAWGSGGLRLRARDMAKLGLLLLRGGVWNEKQIVTTDWVRDSTREYTKGGPPVGTGYGLGWWLGKNDRHRIIFAFGDGGQTIQVYPELEMIIVTTADVGSSGLDPLDRDYIIPAVLK